MKKKTLKKLVLAKETVRSLEDSAMRGLVIGAGAGAADPPTWYESCGDNCPSATC